MGMKEWQEAVETNVNVRLGGDFDWARVTEAAWSAAYVLGLNPEQMGLAVVTAKAIFERIGSHEPAPSAGAPAVPRIVGATGRAHGGASAGS